MLQKVLTKYWLSIHVGLLLLFSFLLLFHEERSNGVMLLWGALLVFETFLLLPSVRRGETLEDARTRGLHRLARDPLVYIGIALSVIGIVRWLNSGCELMYLTDAKVWRFADPPSDWLPFSIEPKAALYELCVSVAMIICCLMVRNGIGHSGRQKLFHFLPMVASVFAVHAVIDSEFGVEPYATGALKSGACNAGSFFVLWLLVGWGALLDFMRDADRRTGIVFTCLIPGNLLGFLYFTEPVSMALYAIPILGVAIYGSFYLKAQQASKINRARYLLYLFLVICAVTGMTVLVSPKQVVSQKLRSFSAPVKLIEQLVDDRDTRSQMVWKIWAEKPWTGFGPDGFMHHLGFYLQEKEWTLFEADKRFVRNDPLQFLCAKGIIGTGVVLAAVLALLIPIGYRLRLVLGKNMGKKEKATTHVGFLHLPPQVLAGLVVCLFCFLEGLIASPFQSGTFLTSWFFIMALIPGFLPVNR